MEGQCPKPDYPVNRDPQTIPKAHLDYGRIPTTLPQTEIKTIEMPSQTNTLATDETQFTIKN